MTLSLDEVRKVAKLARLRLQKDQEEKILDDLNRILSWIDELQQLDTGGVKPLYNAHDATCPLFEDEKSEEESIEKVLSNSPVEPIQNFYRVPKVIE